MRTIGKRKAGRGDRAALDALVLQFGGGAPKGVFRYKSAREANEAQERWTTERVQHAEQIRRALEAPESSCD